MTTRDSLHHGLLKRKLIAFTWSFEKHEIIVGSRSKPNLGERVDVSMEFGAIHELEARQSGQSFIEEGIPTLEINFTDETSFFYRGVIVPKPKCFYFGLDRELVQEWQTTTAA